MCQLRLTDFNLSNWVIGRHKIAAPNGLSHGMEKVVLWILCYELFAFKM